MDKIIKAAVIKSVGYDMLIEEIFKRKSLNDFRLNTIIRTVEKNLRKLKVERGFMWKKQKNVILKKELQIIYVVSFEVKKITMDLKSGIVKESHYIASGQKNAAFADVEALIKFLAAHGFAKAQ